MIAAAMDVETNDRAVATLEQLDKALRPLAARLGPEDDIAVDFAPALGPEPAQ